MEARVPFELARDSFSEGEARETSDHSKGDVVVVKDDASKRLFWKLGVVRFDYW